MNFSHFFLQAHICRLGIVHVRVVDQVVGSVIVWVILQLHRWWDLWTSLLCFRINESRGKC